MCILLGIFVDKKLSKKLLRPRKLFLKFLRTDYKDKAKFHTYPFVLIDVLVFTKFVRNQEENEFFNFTFIR